MHISNLVVLWLYSSSVVSNHFTRKLSFVLNCNYFKFYRCFVYCCVESNLIMAMAKASINTRASRRCYVFGMAKDLDSVTPVMLPTYKDMMRCYQSIRLELKGVGSKEPHTAEISKILAQKILQIWQIASLPTVTHKRVVDMITAYHNKYQNIIKPLKSRNTVFLQEKLKKFETDAKHLFDICACKCNQSDMSVCSCVKTSKVPTDEIPFLIDQRSERKMAIGNVDKVATEILRKRMARKSKELERSVFVREPKQSDIAGTSGIQEVSGFDSSEKSTSSDDDDSGSDADKNFKQVVQLVHTLKKRKLNETTQSSTQMRMSLLKTAKAADLTGASNRTVAKIATAVLEDFKLVSVLDPKYVVDKNKIRRELKKNRKQIQANELTDIAARSIKGLYFDGRKDQTLIQVEGRREIRCEEHISLVEEPESKYFGHVVVQAPVKSAAITREIVCYLQKYKIDFANLTVLGCDGTNVNTGWNGGVLRLIETHVGKPLQWSICLLHANELPLRHLMRKLDGHTKGPYSFSGPIGAQLSECEKKPVIKFQPIQSILPDINIKDLSSDQQYLYKICRAVSEGYCCSSLASSSPGKLSQARWLTTANRLLRLYVATTEPSNSFQTLAGFIVKVYAPMWFQIKQNPMCQHGARHLWKMIELSRQFPVDVREIIHKVISTNAYFAHPENLLLAMITDPENCNIRELGIRRIVKARLEKPHGVRFFKVPKINFQARSYMEMINWQEFPVTEPPLTMSIKDEDLQLMLSEKNVPVLFIDNFPCHTQAVERCVKLVTEASSKVFGEESRDGHIRARLEARKNLPSFENKGQYYSSAKQ